MGFRCPVCCEDFGTDKNKWEKHCNKEHQGVSKEIIKVVKKIVENGKK